MDREIGLLDYWRAVWKRRWLVAALCGLAMVVASIYSLTLPKIFASTVTALMPREDIGFGASRITLPGVGAGGGMGGTGGEGAGLGPWGGLGAAGLSLGLPALGTPNRDEYIAYLNSRTMREEVAAHFKKSWGPSVGPLIGGMTAEVGKDSLLRVTAESQDARLSAELANFYLKHLEDLLGRKAKRIRDLQHKFYLSRLEPARQDLEEAQKALIAFQEKHRTLGLSSSDKAAIAAGAGAATSVVAMEMQRTLKRMYLTDRNPEMIVLDKQIYEAKKLMAHSLYGEAQELPPESPKSPPRKEFFVAATKMTPLQFKAADVMRTLQIRQGVYQMIATSIETAKYSEDAPPPHIELIDSAIPPGGPAKPNVQSYVRSAGIGSLIVGIFLALFLEYFERLRSQARFQVVEPRRPGRRFAPAPELANGPLSAELFDGPVTETYAPDEPVAHSPDRRRPSAESLAQSPEGRRFL